LNLQYQYIELLKKSLLNILYIESEVLLVRLAARIASEQKIGFEIYAKDYNFHKIKNTLYEIKKAGDILTFNYQMPGSEVVTPVSLRNFTEHAHSMIGEARLDNLAECVRTVIEQDIPGDFIETGVWRGGAVIFMKGLLTAYGCDSRCVWVADSFDGVPKPSLPEDDNFDLSKDVLPVLAVSLEEVKSNFSRYGLLDDNVIFLEGWFRDTLPRANIEKLSILRLDGDLYESTMDALVPLYPKVSSGGFIIVDDYESCPPCKQAIKDFRRNNSINSELVKIDGHAVYWRKS
jgi:O-methyltransferase